MTIKFAILGLLSWRPLSGYDLKKIVSDSTLFYWSGNNNQIYKTLVQLHEEELVTQEIQQQASLPAKKLYTVTEKGLSALRDWTRSMPTLPEFRHPFLIQLLWAAQLEPQELDHLLKTYEDEVQMQLIMQQEKIRREGQGPGTTPRERYLWGMIQENIVSSYQKELDWVHRLHRELKENPDFSQEGWNEL